MNKICAAALAVSLVLSACSKEGASPGTAKGKGEEKAAVVRIEPVKKAPLKLTLALTGPVEAGRIAQLASPAEGPVVAVQAREGDRVKSGQILLVLGRTAGVAALEASLREDLKKEEDNLSRTRRLVDSGALAGEQLDNAAAATLRARAAMAKARESSGDFAIRAPWPGVVSKMKVRDGDFVAPRAQLAEVYDPQSLMVRLAVPEQQAATVTEGMAAEVELDAYPGKRFSGKISRLYPYLDSRTRTRTAEITLAEAPQLLPGMFARVWLTRSTLADAITIPAHSLLAMPSGGMAVFIMQEGKAQRRQVKTGLEQEGRVQIVSGLEAGDKLIVAGHERLKEGAAVRLAETGGKKAAEAKPSAPAKGDKS